ncbi:MAG: 2-phospho-L-lactate guanylyltransferase [Acidimicrobiales bacterium]
MFGPSPSSPGVAVLVPVKSFTAAKARLAPALTAAQRAALARRMAGAVVAAAAPLPCFVVCDDDDVATWATAAGAGVLWCPGRGLNQAVGDGVAALADRGFARVVVAHSDLPLARGFARVVGFGGVTVVPDRRDDGTNVLAVPTRAGFGFAYGVGSFRRHAAEARRLALGFRVVRDPLLGFDIDLPGDLAEVLHHRPGLLEGPPPTAGTRRLAP